MRIILQSLEGSELDIVTTYKTNSFRMIRIKETKVWYNNTSSNQTEIQTEKNRYGYLRIQNY